MISGCKEREFDPVTCGQCGDASEEEAKLLGRVVRRGLDLRDHGSGVRVLPVGERGLDERLSVDEVAAEAALRGAESLASGTTATAASPPSAIASSAACGRSDPRVRMSVG